MLVKLAPDDRERDRLGLSARGVVALMHGRRRLVGPDGTQIE
jgi:hypothetical protein